MSSLGLSPLSLSTMTTLSGSQDVIAGAAVAVSSVGSALAIAMSGWVAMGRPLLAALLGPDWIPVRVHRVGHRLS